MHLDHLSFGVLGLARTLKELADSNVVQTMRCCSVLGPALYLTFQSPEKCVRMINDYSAQGQHLSYGPLFTESNPLPLAKV